MTIRKGLPRWLSWLPFGLVPSISPDHLARNPEQYLIIDVRTKLEFNKSHIPGALSIPLHTLTHDLIDKLPADKPVICICLSAHRSKPATRKLIRANYSARELSGGMRAWWKAHLPTESSGGS